MKNKKTILNGVKKDNLKRELGEKCIYCNCNNKIALTIDHKVPFARGGGDIDKNKQVCCFICNQLKGPLTHEEFKKYMKALIILKDLNKLFFKMETPTLTLKPHAFPMTEEYVRNEIDKAVKHGQESADKTGRKS